jgi:hypothetical protein
VDARTTYPGDAAARRGLLFALGAIALIVAIVGLVVGITIALVALSSGIGLLA